MRRAFAWLFQEQEETMTSNIEQANGGCGTATECAVEQASGGAAVESATEQAARGAATCGATEQAARGAAAENESGTSAQVKLGGVAQGAAVDMVGEAQRAQTADSRLEPGEIRLIAPAKVNLFLSTGRSAPTTTTRP